MVVSCRYSAVLMLKLLMFLMTETAVESKVEVVVAWTMLMGTTVEQAVAVQEVV